MNLNDIAATGATWVGSSVKSQKPMSGEELARELNEAIEASAAEDLQPLSVQPVQAAMRPGVVTSGFVVVWGPKG